MQESVPRSIDVNVQHDLHTRAIPYNLSASFVTTGLSISMNMLRDKQMLFPRRVDHDRPLSWDWQKDENWDVGSMSRQIFLSSCMCSIRVKYVTSCTTHHIPADSLWLIVTRCDSLNICLSRCLVEYIFRVVSSCCLVEYIFPMFIGTVLPTFTHFWHHTYSLTATIWHDVRADINSG